MSCHTWVYKRIDSMSQEEINQEIDCVINERLSRAYMSENEDEYANKMVKLTKDSSISPLSYSDAIKRYKEARYETSLIVKKLQEAKRTGDLSLITDINGFDTAENNTYLFLCNDIPLDVMSIQINNVIIRMNLLNLYIQLSQIILQYMMKIIISI